jgi:DNA-binding PadR family transcriptional regulator
MKKHRPTSLGFAILGLLHGQAMTGYDLRKIFAETALGNYSSSPGAIYPALARLEEHGLIDGREDNTKKLRPKKLYRPSDKGRQIFREWLLLDVSAGEMPGKVDELMLRFAFHSVLDSTEATYDFLKGFSNALNDYIEMLKEQTKLFPEEAPIHSRLALDAGLVQYEALAHWARKALRHFEGA